MKTYIIAHLNGSRVPFKILANNEQDALHKVFEHMGSESYHVIDIIP